MGCGPSAILAGQEQPVIVATWKALQKKGLEQRRARAALPPADGSHAPAAVHGKPAKKGEWTRFRVLSLRIMSLSVQRQFISVVFFMHMPLSARFMIVAGDNTDQFAWNAED
ncbi:hypothetical protein Aduo_014397 [Ancylostoma duodenale]